MVQLKTERMLARSEDGIGWMVFNHPAKHNALSLEMWRGIADILEAFAADEEVRVVVMRGAGGKAFVSGADISEFEANRSNAKQKDRYDRVSESANQALANFSKPLIALIEGHCIGGGLATALAADVRFATPDSKFGIPAARLGLGYAYDSLAKLARVAGPARARDMLLSARIMAADEAKSMGLVNFIEERTDIEAKTLAYAKTLAGNAPLSVKASKAALNAWEQGASAAQLEAVEALVNACFDSEDYREGRQAFMAKRKAQFRGR